MNKIMDELIEEAVLQERERLALNLLLSKATNSEVAELTKLPVERIEELRKGLGLIGKHIWELHSKTVRKCAVDGVVRINNQLHAGKKAEEIVEDGYAKELVEQVEQEIFLANQGAERS